MLVSVCMLTSDNRIKLQINKQGKRGQHGRGELGSSKRGSAHVWPRVTMRTCGYGGRGEGCPVAQRRAAELAELEEIEAAEASRRAEEARRNSEHVVRHRIEWERLYEAITIEKHYLNAQND